MAFAKKIEGKTQLVLAVIILAAVSFQILSSGVGEITGALSDFVNEASNATGGNNSVTLGNLPFLRFFTGGDIIYLITGAIIVIAAVVMIFNMLKAGGNKR